MDVVKLVTLPVGDGVGVSIKKVLGANTLLLEG